MAASFRRLALVAAWVVACGPAGAAQGTRHPGLATALSGLAARVQEYYGRISTIICLETVTQQELSFDLKPTGKPRVTVNELSVIRDLKPKSDTDFRVERKLQSVNGRAAREHEE